MRHRLSSILVVLALLVVACNPATGTDTTDGADTTAPPATTPAPESMVLSYTLEPGASFTYEVDLDQAIDLTTSGDAEALGEEEIPGEMSITMKGTSTFTHTVAEGPTPGTFEVRIVGDFSNLEFSGTMDGVPVDPTEIPDLAEMEPIDVTVVVDEQGNVISGAEGDMNDLLGEFGGGLGGLEGFTQGSPLGGFVGPPFSDEEVTVGDSWSETVETPLFEDEVHTTEIESTVTGTDAVDGVDVLVIETTISSAELDFDLAELLIGMFGTFLPEDATDEEKAELDALAEHLRFRFVVAASVGEMTTLFDPESGMTVSSEFSGANQMEMDINMPDDETGEMVAFGMAMDLSQTLTFRLVDSASA
jgi:hypothetical protein